MERESNYILSIESLNVHVDGLCYLRWATVCSGEYPNVLLNLVLLDCIKLLVQSF